MLYWYQAAKSLHFIGVISWMAGIFYLVRIMVYHAEARQLQDASRSILEQQYQLMEQRAYQIIIVPAVWISWICGSIMLSLQPVWLTQGWMHVKLLFLVLLSGYTHYCKGHIRLLASAEGAPSHLFYRAMNEVPTILMAGIVFLAVYKQGINWWMWAVGVFGFAALILFAVKKASKRLSASNE